MHVTTDQDCEFVRQGREWVFTTRVTVHMSDAERWQMDGVRVEAFGWTRFRLKLSRQPLGAQPGGWRYEVRDNLYRDDDTGEPAVVRSGARPTWDTAHADGLAVLFEVKRAAIDNDNQGTVTLPVAEHADGRLARHAGQGTP